MLPIYYSDGINVKLRAEYLQQTRTAQTDIETPLLYRAAGFTDEKQMLIDMVKLRVQKGERVAVLLPLNKQVYGFAKGMREAGLDVETPDNLDFSSDIPKVITYHSVKGLTFDAVLMPRLTQNSFPRFSSERIERLLFVALTRATRWIYLSTDGMLPQLQRIESLVKEKRLTIKTPASPLTELPVTSKNNTEDLLDAL
jgi:superfamily I DNA/RNA helicase